MDVDYNSTWMVGNEIDLFCLDGLGDYSSESLSIGHHHHHHLKCRVLRTNAERDTGAWNAGYDLRPSDATQVSEIIPIAFSIVTFYSNSIEL